MPIKIYKPTSPGRRKSSALISGLIRKRPERSLISIKKSKAGRAGGKISVRHRGGGAKKFYRLIDFRRDKFDTPARVEAIEYDPNRSTNIALLQYQDNEKRYIIAPQDIKVGDQLLSSKKAIAIKPGNTFPLEFIPTGLMVHNIELIPGQGGKLVRGAGMGAQVMGLEKDYVILKMPSGEIRMFRKDCLATIGQVGNAEWRTIRWGKAGRMRHRGIRPTVRGKAMNPVDHPHGGGEGGSPIGLKHPKTPWGRPALGVKTRRKKKWSNKLILKRRK